MPLLNLQFKTMKKLVFFLCLIAVAGCAQAQTTFTPPPAIPAYRILKPDSTYTSYTDLNKHKPVMIIYFSPDCSHCQHLMHEMKPYMKQFKNIQVVMITFTRIEFPYLRLLKDFSRDFELGKYPNFTVGTEYPTYKTQQYYHVSTTPYIALYDKNGKPAHYYEKAPKIEELVAEVKKL